MEAQKHIIRWMEDFIIGMNICPFAQRPWQAGKVQLVESSHTAPVDIYDHFDQIMSDFSQSQQYSTCLFYLPNLKMDFLEFNDFSLELDQLLAIHGQDELYQLVVFHPGFYFAQTNPEDLCNYVNRSPYPMIHILRIEEVANAVLDAQGGERISLANEKRIKATDPQELKKIFWYLKL